MTPARKIAALKAAIAYAEANPDPVRPSLVTRLYAYHKSHPLDWVKASDLVGRQFSAWQRPYCPHVRTMQERLESLTITPMESK